MKKKYFCTAFAAALLFAGFAFTACDDDDDNSAPGTKPTIKFENVIPTKNYVQSGTFAAVAPGQTTSFTFHAAKGQRLMFATMYSNSNDLFFGRSPGRRGNRSEGHGLRRTQLSGRIEPAPGEPDLRCRTVAVHLYDLQYFCRHGE